MDAADQSRLRELLRRESGSLLRYVSDADPWAAPKDRPALDQLRAMAAAETAALEALAERLLRRRVPRPGFAGFPMTFTSLNFLALTALLPRLIDAQRLGVAALTEDEAGLHDAEFRGRVADLRALKDRHREELEKLRNGAGN
jgi:hypothetical protein